jgi:hypothetical protein
MTSSTVNPHASGSGGKLRAPAQQLYQEYKAQLCHSIFIGKFIYHHTTKE